MAPVISRISIDSLVYFAFSLIGNKRIFYSFFSAKIPFSPICHRLIWIIYSFFFQCFSIHCRYGMHFAHSVHLKILQNSTELNNRVHSAFSESLSITKYSNVRMFDDSMGKMFLFWPISEWLYSSIVTSMIIIIVNYYEWCFLQFSFQFSSMFSFIYTLSHFCLCFCFLLFMRF